MTPLQRQKARLKAKQAKEREKAKARRARALLRRQKRAAKRLSKAAPAKGLKAWATAVKTRDGGKCAVCGCGDVVKRLPDGNVKLGKNGQPVVSRLNVHHLLPKERYPEFKFEPVNGVLLCPMHHKFSRYSAHRNPVWFTLWLRAARPEQFKWCKLNMGNPVGVV